MSFAWGNTKCGCESSGGAILGGTTIMELASKDTEGKLVRTIPIDLNKVTTFVRSFASIFGRVEDDEDLKSMIGKINTQVSNGAPIVKDKAQRVLLHKTVDSFNAAFGTNFSKPTSNDDVVKYVEILGEIVANFSTFINLDMNVVDSTDPNAFAAYLKNITRVQFEVKRGLDQLKELKRLYSIQKSQNGKNIDSINGVIEFVEQILANIDAILVGSTGPIAMLMRSNGPALKFDPSEINNKLNSAYSELGLKVVEAAQIVFLKNVMAESADGIAAILKSHPLTNSSANDDINAPQVKLIIEALRNMQAKVITDLGLPTGVDGDVVDSTTVSEAFSTIINAISNAGHVGTTRDAVLQIMDRLDSDSVIEVKGGSYGGKYGGSSTSSKYQLQRNNVVSAIKHVFVKFCMDYSKSMLALFDGFTSTADVLVEKDIEIVTEFQELCSYITTIGSEIKIDDLWSMLNFTRLESTNQRVKRIKDNLQILRKYMDKISAMEIYSPLRAKMQELNQRIIEIEGLFDSSNKKIESVGSINPAEMDNVRNATVDDSRIINVLNKIHFMSANFDVKIKFIDRTSKFKRSLLLSSKMMKRNQEEYDTNTTKFVSHNVNKFIKAVEEYKASSAADQAALDKVKPDLIDQMKTLAYTVQGVDALIYNAIENISSNPHIISDVYYILSNLSLKYKLDSPVVNYNIPTEAYVLAVGFLKVFNADRNAVMTAIAPAAVKDELKVILDNIIAGTDASSFPLPPSSLGKAIVALCRYKSADNTKFISELSTGLLKARGALGGTTENELYNEIVRLNVPNLKFTTYFKLMVQMKDKYHEINGFLNELPENADVPTANTWRLAVRTAMDEMVAIFTNIIDMNSGVGGAHTANVPEHNVPIASITNLKNLLATQQANFPLGALTTALQVKEAKEFMKSDFVKYVKEVLGKLPYSEVLNDVINDPYSSSSESEGFIALFDLVSQISNISVFKDIRGGKISQNLIPLAKFKKNVEKLEKMRSDLRLKSVITEYETMILDLDTLFDKGGMQFFTDVRVTLRTVASALFGFVMLSIDYIKDLTMPLSTDLTDSRPSKMVQESMMMHGGAEGEEINQDISELYIRITLLAEFYVKFLTQNKAGAKASDTSKLILLFSNNDVYGSIISTVYERMYDVEKPYYDDASINRLIRDINKMYATFKNVNNTIDAFIDEVSSKIGLVSMNEIDLYTKSATKSIDERGVEVTKPVRDLTYLDMSTDYGNDKWEPTSSAYIESKFGNGGADDGIFKLDADWVLSSLKTIGADYDAFMKSASPPDEKSVTEIVKNIRSNLADADGAEEKFTIIKAAINNGLYTDGAYFYKKLFINEFIKTNLTVLYETLRFVGHLGKQINTTHVKVISAASADEKNLARAKLFKLLNYAVSVPNKLVSLEIRPKSLVLDFSKMQKMVKECFEQTNVMLSILKQIPTYRKEEGIIDADTAMYDISFYAIDLFVNDTFINGISEPEKDVANEYGLFSSSKMNSKLNTIFSVEMNDIDSLVYKKADKFVSYPVSTDIKFIDKDSVITRDYFYVPDGKNDDLSASAGDDKSLVYFFNSMLMRLFNTVRTNEDRYLKSFITNLADGMSDMLTSEYIADNADFDLLKFRDDYARAITRNGDIYGSGKSFYAKIFEDVNATIIKNGSKYTIEGITEVKQAIDLFTKIPLPLEFRNFTQVEVATNAFVKAHINEMQTYEKYDKLDDPIAQREFWYKKREQINNMTKRTIKLCDQYLWKLCEKLGIQTDLASISKCLPGGTDRVAYLAEVDIVRKKTTAPQADEGTYLAVNPFDGANIYGYLNAQIAAVKAAEKALPKLRNDLRAATTTYNNSPDLTQKTRNYKLMVAAKALVDDKQDIIDMYNKNTPPGEFMLTEAILSLAKDAKEYHYNALGALMQLIDELSRERNRILSIIDPTILTNVPDASIVNPFQPVPIFGDKSINAYVDLYNLGLNFVTMLTTYPLYSDFKMTLVANVYADRCKLDRLVILSDVLKVVDTNMLNASTDSVSLAKKQLYKAASDRLLATMIPIINSRKSYRAADGNRADPYTIDAKYDALKKQIESVLTTSLIFGSLITSERGYDKYREQMIDIIRSSMGLDRIIARTISSDVIYNRSDQAGITLMRNDLYAFGCVVLAASNLLEITVRSKENSMKGDDKKYLEYINKGNKSSPVVSPLLLLMIKTFLDRRTDAPISTEYHLISDISELQSHHISSLNTKLPYFEKTFISIQHLCKNSILFINTLPQSPTNMTNKKKLEKTMELCSIIVEAIKDILNQIGQSTEYFETENKGIQKIQTMNNSTAIPFMPFSHLMYQFNDNFGDYDTAKVGSMEFKYLNGIKCVMANYGNVDLSSFAKMRGVGWLLSKFNNSGFTPINEALYLANIQTDVNLMRHLSDFSSNMKMTNLKKSHTITLPEHMSIDSIYNYTKMKEAEEKKKLLLDILNKLLTTSIELSDELDVLKDNIDIANIDLASKIAIVDTLGINLPASGDVDDTKWLPFGENIKSIGDLNREVYYAKTRSYIAQNSYETTHLLVEITEGLLNNNMSFFLTKEINTVIAKLNNAISEIGKLKTKALDELDIIKQNDDNEKITMTILGTRAEYVTKLDKILDYFVANNIKNTILPANTSNVAAIETAFDLKLRYAFINTARPNQEVVINNTSKANFKKFIDSPGHLTSSIVKTDTELTELKSEDQRAQQSLSSTTVETIVNVSTGLDTSIDKNIQLLFSDNYMAKVSGKEALILQNIVDLNTNPIKLSALQREYPLLYIFTLAKYGLEILKKHPTSKTDYYNYNSSNLVNFIKAHIRETFTKSNPIVYKGLEWIKPDPQEP